MLKKMKVYQWEKNKNSWQLAFKIKEAENNNTTNNIRVWETESFIPIFFSSTESESDDDEKAKPSSSHNEIQHFIEDEVPSQNDDSSKHEDNYVPADEHPAKEDHSIKTEELEKKGDWFSSLSTLRLYIKQHLLRCRTDKVWNLR